MKKVIFSCLFGDYDTLNPAPKFEGWDAVLFTDKKPKKKLGWDVRVVDSQNAKVESRRYKFLSHIHLAEYDLACYQDANIILNQAPPDYPTWLRHPKRRSVREEARAVIKGLKANAQMVTFQMMKYRRDRFMDNVGLYANGFFVRDHSEPINKLMELSFSVYEIHPTRDQFALPYAVWKTRIKPAGLVNYYLNDSHVTFKPHDKIEAPDRVQVHHITAARADKNFGKAVNDLIEGLPDHDWICLRDIDTVPPYHEEFIKQVEDLANSDHGYSLIGCMTNRLGLDYQLVKGMFHETDIRKHRDKAKELSQIKSIKKLGINQTVGGVMMLFPKLVWRKVGKFPEGGISINNHFVDYHFSQAVKKFGRLGIAEGVYLFHMYRIEAKDTRTYKEHLK